MSDDDKVGYGRPPRAHQFKPGNQAARGRKKKQAVFSIPELLTQALKRKRKIKRGDKIVTMQAGEIMIERFISMMTTGTPRDLVAMLGLIEKHLPRFFEQHAAKMEVIYYQAEGSDIAMPPDELWEPKT